MSLAGIAPYRSETEKTEVTEVESSFVTRLANGDTRGTETINDKKTNSSHETILSKRQQLKEKPDVFIETKITIEKPQRVTLGTEMIIIKNAHQFEIGSIGMLPDLDVVAVIDKDTSFVKRMDSGTYKLGIDRNGFVLVEKIEGLHQVDDLLIGPEGQGVLAQALIKVEVEGPKRKSLLIQQLKQELGASFKEYGLTNNLARRLDSDVRKIGSEMHLAITNSKNTETMETDEQNKLLDHQQKVTKIMEERKNGFQNSTNEKIRTRTTTQELKEALGTENDITVTLREHSEKEQPVIAIEGLTKKEALTMLGLKGKGSREYIKWATNGLQVRNQAIEGALISADIAFRYGKENTSRVPGNVEYEPKKAGQVTDTAEGIISVRDGKSMEPKKFGIKVSADDNEWKIEIFDNQENGPNAAKVAPTNYFKATLKNLRSNK